MIQYAINHFVTTGDSADSIVNSTVQGDDSLHVWIGSDPMTDPADEVHEVPPDGWSWRPDRWQDHLFQGQSRSDSKGVQKARRALKDASIPLREGQVEV